MDCLIRSRWTRSQARSASFPLAGSRNRRIGWYRSRPSQNGEPAAVSVRHVKQARRRILEFLAGMTEDRREHTASTILGELATDIGWRVVITHLPRQERIGKIDGTHPFVVPGHKEEARRAETLPWEVAGQAASRRADEFLFAEVVAVADMRYAKAGNDLRIRQIRYVDYPAESGRAAEEFVGIDNELRDRRRSRKDGDGTVGDAKVLAAERRHIVEAGNLHRMRAIRDIQNDHPRIAIRDIDLVLIVEDFVTPNLLRRAVRIGPGVGRPVGFANLLPLDVEAADLDRVGRIDIVDDHQFMVGEESLSGIRL